MRYIDEDGTRCVEDNDFESLKEWVESGCDIDYCEENSYNALTCAALWGRTEMAKYLIEKGANVNEKQEFGQTSLHIAVEYQSKEIVQLLLNAGAETNIIGQYGMTPLLYASNPNSQRGSALKGEEVEARRLEIAEMLLTAGANIHLTGLHSGTTPISDTRKRNDTEMIKLLEKFDHWGN